MKNFTRKRDSSQIDYHKKMQIKSRIMQAGRARTETNAESGDNGQRDDHPSSLLTFEVLPKTSEKKERENKQNSCRHVCQMGRRSG